MTGGGCRSPPFAAVTGSRYEQRSKPLGTTRERQRYGVRVQAVVPRGAAHLLGRDVPKSEAHADAGVGTPAQGEIVSSGPKSWERRARERCEMAIPYAWRSVHGAKQPTSSSAAQLDEPSVGGHR